jgi:hypothetical protein
MTILKHLKLDRSSRQEDARDGAISSSCGSSFGRPYPEPLASARSRSCRVSRASVAARSRAAADCLQRRRRSERSIAGRPGHPTTRTGEVRVYSSVVEGADAISAASSSSVCFASAPRHRCCCCCCCCCCATAAAVTDDVGGIPLAEPVSDDYCQSMSMRSCNPNRGRDARRRADNVGGVAIPSVAHV